MGKITDLTGHRFGMLLVLGIAPRTTSQISWRCKCDCGVEKSVMRGNLASGGTVSCGCIAKDLISKSRTTHGVSQSKQYNIWRGMLKRCESPKDKSFPSYGGRGIKVSPEWHDFMQFWDDMGATYQEGLSIERIDVNGNYEAGNCTWIPFSDQYKNRRPPPEWRITGRPNPFGLRGVSLSRGRWVAMISINAKSKYLGSFNTPEEASAAFAAAYSEKYACLESHSLLEHIRPKV